MNFFADSPEWQYQFRHGIDWDAIIPLYYPDYPTRDGHRDRGELLASFEELLTSTGAWAGETLAPRARELDRAGGGNLRDGRIELSGPLRQSYSEAAALDLFGLSAHPRHGGLGVPLTVGLLAFNQVARACVATSAQFAFSFGMPDMLERFCDDATAARLIPRIRRAELSGSMCLTEPDCGSDLGALRTTAERRPDGRYRLDGSKAFITNGGGGFGFVLARVKGAPAGLDGLSLFLAEQEPEEPVGAGPPAGARRPNYGITRIEDKLGMRGSVTCAVHYEDTVARLVGREGEGFRIMLHLMNEARVSVGLQSLGAMEACVGHARDYAETRRQFGRNLAELPLFRRNLRDWETERDAFRALMADTVSHYDVFQRLELKRRHAGELSQEQDGLFRRAARKVRRRTPLVKYYGAEAAAILSQRAIQALGGYGYMKDYDAERLHRDAIGALLYEGTSQIQALMATKDFVKGLLKDPSGFLQSTAAGSLVPSFVGDSELTRSFKAVEFGFRRHAVGLIIRCFKPGLRLGDLAGLSRFSLPARWQEAERFDPLMAHAETVCQALAYLETLEVLGRQAKKDPERGELYRAYLKLVTPRLSAIYADWRQ